MWCGGLFFVLDSFASLSPVCSVSLLLSLKRTLSFLFFLFFSVCLLACSCVFGKKKNYFKEKQSHNRFFVSFLYVCRISGVNASVSHN